MSELELFLLMGVLTQNFNTVDLVKNLEKDQKLHIQTLVVTLKVMSCRTMSKKKIVKKSEKPRFYGQNKLFFENPTLLPLGSFSHMAACRSSLENIGKMSLIPVFNKNSPRAHTELELDVLGVHRKLVKYVVTHLRKKIEKKLKILHTSCLNNN
jgi:phosphomevalonate kinase